MKHLLHAMFALFLAGQVGISGATPIVLADQYTIPPRDPDDFTIKYLLPLAKSDITFSVWGEGLDLSNKNSEWVGVNIQDVGDGSRRQYGKKKDYCADTPSCGFTGDTGNNSFTDAWAFSNVQWNKELMAGNPITFEVDWGSRVKAMSGQANTIGWAFSYVAVPEPMTLPLFGIGLIGMRLIRKRKQAL